MTRYVIAVGRGFRAEVGRDWATRLAEVEGLEIVGVAGGVRVQVEATEEAIARAREVLGDYFHIEPLMPHNTQTDR